MTEWQTMTAAELGRGIDTGEIDPVELTNSFLDAIDSHEHRDRIYIRLTPDRALSEAKAAQERARLKLRRSPLDGVPISWKDLFDTAGVVTEAGSMLLEGRTPDADAEVLQAATHQGLVCLGKTHLSELAFSGLGLNPKTATSPNIHNPDNAPGGSSSGAATSVAFGLAPAAIGSDTGGSVRVPSAWNDLVGLKTTSGVLSLKGAVPLAAKFDTVGPLCKSVEDAALLFAVMKGETPIDMTPATLKGRRLAILTTTALDEVRDDPRKGFDHAVQRFRDAGATITELAVPEVDTAMALAPILYGSEAYGTWKDVIEANPDVMFAEILARFRSGKDFSGADYVAAWHTLERCRDTYLTATAGYDAVLCPTSPITPPNVERLMTDSDYYVTENLLTLRNTRIGNLMGLCALTLPTGVPACGVTLMARPRDERRLLRLGLAAEAALA
ncbi:amidase [Marivita sp. XM-24bin2]|jgi:aspartyl-tRNA(Asn)/glutamyl-tRNA(Gln) amidotransferase subunit A|uniref:amidase n=1 Tax=unclassified Marivita TaxID=2632480 RepID=UPI000D79B420|nr:amidase [Marivita sp. XM-24bin2]MCR9107644.1 amidase [Paracoccaceae bacterium]PWL35549.1 MAG: amidase [Marivita sp. XM-24bin2]